MTSKTQKIISVKKLKKKGMYEVNFLTFDLKVTEDLIVKYNLVPNKEIDNETIELIKKEEVKEEYFLKTLNYISYQMRSEMEIRMYLNKLEASSADKELIIKRLKDLDFIDDYHYSELILDNCISNKKGPNKYKEKLFSKGIKEYAPYLEEFELDAITEAIKKNKDNKKGLPKQKQKLALTNKLLSDGFTPALVYSKVSVVEFIDNSSELIDKDIEKLKRKYYKLKGKELINKLVIALRTRGYDYKLIKSKLKDFDYYEED